MCEETESFYFILFCRRDSGSSRDSKFPSHIFLIVEQMMLTEDYSGCSSELWEGFVPISVSLAPSDSTSNELLDPVHVLVPRYNFLLIMLADVVANFQQNAIEFSSDIWFEGRMGEPLRW